MIVLRDLLGRAPLNAEVVVNSLGDESCDAESVIALDVAKRDDGTPVVVLTIVGSRR